MTQVESISQSVELNQKEAVQLENFLNLLVDLKIIEPPEQMSPLSSVDNSENEDFSVEIVQGSVSKEDLESFSIDLDATIEEPQNSLISQNSQQQCFSHCQNPVSLSSLKEVGFLSFNVEELTNILEVAGYCYLAIVVRGQPQRAFIWKIRKTLGKLVKDYGEPIEKFDGDSDTIPSQIHTLLAALKDDDAQTKKRKNQPTSLLILSLSVLSIILIPWGIWQYRSGIIRSVENKTALALASAPELAVYRLIVEEDWGKLKLTGRVPNQLLRQKAEQIARITAPKWLIDNHILPVEVPADPVLAAAEVKRVREVLNQMDGTAISAQYIAGKVSVLGTVSRIADAKTIQKAFEQIPGVKSVFSTVQVQALQIEVRFYFEPNLAILPPQDLGYKLGRVKFFLNQHPTKHLKIIGYSYSATGGIEAQQLAFERAKAVQQALIYQGVEPSRLHIIGKTTLPPGIDAAQPLWLRRCIVLEPIAPVTKLNFH